MFFSSLPTSLNKKVTRADSPAIAMAKETWSDADMQSMFARVHFVYVTLQFLFCPVCHANTPPTKNLTPGAFARAIVRQP